MVQAQYLIKIILLFKNGSIKSSDQYVLLMLIQVAKAVAHEGNPEFLNWSLVQLNRISIYLWLGFLGEKNMIEFLISD